MRALRPATLLPRLGLAGAALLATAVVFAVAGGLVAFGLWPEQGRPAGDQRLVLPGTVAHTVRDRQPPSRADERPRSGRAPSAAASAGAPNAVARPSQEITAPDEPDPATPGPPPVPQPSAPLAPRPAVAEPARPLVPVVETVGETTSALATSLRKAAVALAHGLAAIDPAGGPSVTPTGAALAETVDETGRALHRALRGPGPGPGP